MHIAIDAHSVGAKLGGNETYATNLIEALAEIDQLNRYTLYVTKREAIERFANRWRNFTVKQTLPHTPLVRIPLTLVRELRRHPVDVLHVQYTAPPLAPCPVVATIHDLAFEHLPETFNRRSWMQMRLTVRRTARRAAQIITVSEYSRQDISRTYKIEPQRILVTPEAARAGFSPVTNETELKKVRKTYGIERDYILSLCSIQPRKNLVRLIEAYSLLRQSRPEVKLPQLVLAGKRGWLDGETFNAARQSVGGSDILFTGYVGEEDLPALYSGAACFVYPSYFEGFGLPILEAMQCGAPVVAGNRTSIPELVADAGLLFDPFDTSALVEALKRILDDAEYRARLRAKGFLRSGEFSWKETAQLTLKAYEKAFEASRFEHKVSH
ncbi:MAG TPA: glycosyltransferase family 1 protein [Pyrinomonadaceae bacterium]|nr:glycosyltransferase family 1 protein [Pyrinomonadaceae bacterium]